MPRVDASDMNHPIGSISDKVYQTTVFVGGMPVSMGTLPLALRSNHGKTPIIILALASIAVMAEHSRMAQSPAPVMNSVPPTSDDSVH